MKRISLAYALLLLVSLSLAAADAPTPTPQQSPQAPIACTPKVLQDTGLMEKPMFKSTLEASCSANCPSGDPVSCTSTGGGACLMLDQCWVICDNNVPVFCLGRQYEPECAIF